MRELVDHVESISGHRFRDLALLLTALTHSSYRNEHPKVADNERLEFLGDAVVELTVTVMLTERFPECAEGRLTEMRQRIVRNRSLGAVGHKMGISRFMRLGRSEAGKPAVEPAILGDAVEALFGALFKEAGLERVQAFANRWLGHHLEALEVATHTRSAINLLQELTQDRFGETPTYLDESNGEAHALTWTMQVVVDGEVLAVGEGHTKTEARTHAAQLALRILQRREAQQADGRPGADGRPA